LKPCAVKTSMKRLRWKKISLELLGIVAGTAVMAAGFNMFLIPHRIAAGGVSGLGVVLFHLYGLPVGLVVLALNVPLFLLAWKFMGWKVVANSLAGTLLLPFMLETLAFLPPVTEDLFLASIYGGILVGLGLGVVFRFHGSTGGTALAALLINRFLGWSSGQGLIGADLLIILLAGVAFGAEVAMLALLSLFITSKVIDVIQEGLSYSKAAIIISDRREEITERIFQELGRGATFLQGWGAYTRSERGIVLCVLPQYQVSRMKNIVREEDPGAFVIIGSVGEVLGEGFQKME